MHFKTEDLLQDYIAPIQKWENPLFEAFGVSVWLKRDDLLPAPVSGNKWWKLKYNLLAYFQGNYKGIISFGGAYSNHLHALSLACKRFEIPLKVVVRGEWKGEDSPTLSDLKKQNAEIVFVPKSDYAIAKEHPGNIFKQIEDYYIVPEGGSNDLGIKGCTEQLNGIAEKFDFIAVPMGTGATLSGLILSDYNAHFLGFAAFRDGDNSFENSFQVQLQQLSVEHKFLPTYELIFDFAGKGFGKTVPSQIEWMQRFNSNYGWLPDIVYNSKMLMGIETLIQQQKFPFNCRILCIITGGEQGNRSQLSTLHC